MSLNQNNHNNYSSEEIPHGGFGDQNMTSQTLSEPSKACCSLSQSTDTLESLNKESSCDDIASETKESTLDRLSYVCAHQGPKIVSSMDTQSLVTEKTICTSPLLDSTTTLPKKESSIEDECLQLELSSAVSSGSSTSFSRLNECSAIMCRICHCGEEEEKLMITCRCMGTVKYAHQNCVLNWISKSGNQYCELCKYKFKTRRKKVKSLWKWKFPSVSTKGWLHIGLFIAFVTMLLTSITWIVWSRVSSTPTAVAERTTDEVKFAYMLNGLFIALAVGGLYFDSYRHVKRYFQRWSVLNRHMIIEPYCKPSSQGGAESTIDENPTTRPISTTSIAVEISENEANTSVATGTDRKTLKKSKGTWV